MSTLHVVVGASGGAGNAVVRELVSRGRNVRAISRRRQAEIPPGVEHFQADASDVNSLRDACRDAAVVYHCANVPYHLWSMHLVPITRAIIAASAAAGAKLVVMDNLYMYGPVTGPMTETTPRNARGRKGRLRTQLEHLLLDAHRSGAVKVAIGRASDFFGPRAISVPMLLVVQPALRGGKAWWPGRLDAPHTVSYLPDVAWGLVTLGERDESSGEIWHLPAGEPLTGRQFIGLVFHEQGTPLRYGTIRRPVMILAGLLSPMIREGVEVLYQFERPFVMDASKFTRAFGSRVTAHREAIRKTLDALRAGTPFGA